MSGVLATGPLKSNLLRWIDILDHFSDYFEDPLVCGEPLGSTTDQIIEGMHSYVDKSMKKSGHWIDDSSTILCGLKQHEGVLKINAFSMNLK